MKLNHRVNIPRFCDTDLDGNPSSRWKLTGPAGPVLDPYPVRAKYSDFRPFDDGLKQVAGE
jgi:hypothetical protein